MLSTERFLAFKTQCAAGWCFEFDMSDLHKVRIYNKSCSMHSQIMLSAAYRDHVSKVIFTIDYLVKTTVIIQLM